MSESILFLHNISTTVANISKDLFPGKEALVSPDITRREEN